MDETELGLTNNVAACGGPFCGHACRSEGLFFSAEIVFVDIWQDDDDNLAARLLEFHTPAAPGIGSLEPDIDATARFAIGWQTCDGLAVQARFWEYENAASTTLDNTTVNFVSHGWDLSVFDLEVVKNTMVNQVWDTTLSGGYRLAEYEEGVALRGPEMNQMMPDMDVAAVRTRYVGNGFTGAVGVRRQCANRLSIMSNARVSLLFGSQTISTKDVDLPRDPLRSSFDVRYTVESQLGASYEHPICGGGLWFARGGVEVQYWNDFVVPVGRQTDPTSTVLLGLFLAAGLQR